MLSTGRGNSVAQKATDEASYLQLLTENSVAQNSWNYEFFNEPTDHLHFPHLSAFDPNQDGTYRIELAAFYEGQQVASTGINVVVGDGAAVVPLPAALPMLIGALGGLALLRRRSA